MTMSDNLIGQSCALLTALIWALAIVLFKRGGETVPPLALNLFKNTVGLVLLAVTLLIWRPDFGDFASRPAKDYWILLASGFIGIAVADTIFLHALNLVGVGIQAIVDCLYSPFVILFAYLLLAESLSPHHYAGAGLILSAVLISSRHKPPPNRTPRQITIGVLLGAVSMALMAYGIVLAKPVLDSHGGDFPLLWATALRLLAGTLPLALWIPFSAERAAARAIFKPGPAWRFCVPGAFLGAYLSMILWLAGFKYIEKSGIAGILNQTSTVFALIFATVILKEGFTRRKLLAVLLAMGGVVLASGGALFDRDTAQEEKGRVSVENPALRYLQDDAEASSVLSDTL